jgi:hypothetical protein
MAELIHATGVHPRYPDLNLRVEGKYFLFLFVLHLNSNMPGFKS